MTRPSSSVEVLSAADVLPAPAAPAQNLLSTALATSLHLELEQPLSDALRCIGLAEQLNLQNPATGDGASDALAAAASQLGGVLSSIHGVRVALEGSVGDVEVVGPDLSALDSLGQGGAGIARPFSGTFAPDPFIELTPREHQVLLCVIRGKVNKVIARELGISPRTVEAHRAKAMAKTSCENVPALVAQFIAFEIGRARSLEALASPPQRIANEDGDTGAV